MVPANGNPPEPIHLPPATALTPQETRALMVEVGAQPYRADQVQQGLIAQQALSWDEIKGLPGELKAKLKDRISLFGSRLTAQVTSPDKTTKLALEYPDGQVVEAAIIPTDGRATLCISTQAGCPVGCAFCASGKGGLVRNLAAWEILEQALYARAVSPDRINRLVVMGVGEPLFNLTGLLPALDRICAPDCLGIGARKIVVSTVGIIPGIAKLAQRTPHLQLAVSIHAANQGLREKLVPLARKYPVGKIVDAARDYQKKTGRQVTFEIVLVAGINDSNKHAREMALLLGNQGFHANLIPLNPIGDLSWRSSPPEQVQSFAEVLKAGGLTSTIRQSRGAAENAACGQLRVKGI